MTVAANPGVGNARVADERTDRRNDTATTPADAAVIAQRNGVGLGESPPYAGTPDSRITSVNIDGSVPNFALYSSRVGTSRTLILLSWCRAMSENL